MIIKRTSAILQATAAAVALLLVGTADGAAQYRERPESYQRNDDRNARAGAFDYYVLALSWSPTYCAENADARHEPQCNVRSERRYAFVLHGLWPQHEHRWPQFCRSTDRGYVPEPVARRMLDIMPSRKLVFHQYRKHGTCSGLGVDGYFDLSRRLHDSIKIPARYVNLDEDRLFVSPEQLVGEFLKANPALDRDMIAVQCGSAGNRLKEVRICFGRNGAPRACGRNEDQKRLCAAQRMYVPPVRTGSADDASGPRQARDKRELLPGPR